MPIGDQYVFSRTISEWAVRAHKSTQELWVELWEETMLKCYLIVCGVTDLEFLDQPLS